MAESVTALLLNKIGLFLDQEIKLLGGVRTEVEHVKGELEHMKAFLRVAESREETDEQAKVWIKQVRDVAFDIEDVIDEFTLRLAQDRRGMESCSIIYKIIQFVKNNAIYRHQIATEIQNIKIRVNRVAAGRNRYKLAPQEQGLIGGATATTSTLWQEHRKNALLQDEADLVGIENPKKLLMDLINEDEPALKVISVVGMGGLGKTTLIKKVYDNVKNGFDKYAWINVSQSFNAKLLFKELIKNLHEQRGQEVPEGLETMASDALKEKIKEFIRESRFLLVLDDIWQTEAWDYISHAFPWNNFGSRVILTTRKIEVAKASCGRSRGVVYPLQPLSSQESWALFRKRIFWDEECPPPLVTIAGEILEMCEGLPLAIVAICGLLATRGRSKVEWELVKRSIPAELDGGKLGTVEKILLLSYYDLPFYLKACLLYVCIFPEDYEIDSMRLIRLWIAEGFVQEQERMTLEEVAEGYLYELLNRSLIQVAHRDKTSRIRKFRIHDILREVVLAKAKDESFVMIISGEQERMRHEKTARRWSVHNELMRSSELGVDNYNKSKLRSLLLFYVHNFQFSKSFGNHLRLLTVLDLRETNLMVFPKEVLKLYHLKYLSLRNTNVRVLPTSIWKLQNLETLDLKDTSVFHLPATIVTLHRLRYLMSYAHSHLSKKTHQESGLRTISKLGCLHSLHKLCFIKVEDHNAHDTLEEIGRLNQLRRLGIGDLRFEHGEKLCSTIEMLNKLRSLWIESVTMEESIDLQHITSPLQFLQRIYVHGRLERIPKWFSSLENLSKLELSRSQLMDDVLEPIQALPSLEHLVLEAAFAGEKLYFRSGGFQKLKILWVWELHDLRVVEVEKGAMANLEELLISDCQSLQNVPFGTEHLAKLQILHLRFVSADLVSSIREGNDHYWRVKHIPNVRIE